MNPKDDLQATRARFAYESYVKNPDPSFQDKVYARARDTGWAAGNRWLFMLFPNWRVRDAIGMNFVPDVARLAITCKSVNLNEVTWYSTEQGYIHAGASRILPYKRNSNNASGFKVQFNVGTDMFEKEFFESWLRYIQNPYTRQWRFYEDYAKDSFIYLLMLPNHVQNFNQAMEAMYQGKIVGYKFTEVYPFSMNMNGGNLNYNAVAEPLFSDIGFMYNDMVPIQEEGIKYKNVIPTVTDTGYPVIERDKYKDILEGSQRGLDKAVNGFALGTIAERGAFNALRQKQQSVLQSYVKQLEEYKSENFPRAVDGRVVYSTPRQGGLDLGLTLLSQTQGFFGAGFFGNGFLP
jgi:hypothetical protein